MKPFGLLKKNDGAAAVEFAIVLPLFIVLTFGIIEFGIIMYNKALITNASREGARFGILFTVENITSTDIETRVKDKLGIDPENPGQSLLISLGGSAEPTIDSENIIVSDQEYLKVTVTYPYDFLLVPSFVPGLSEIMNIATTTTMRMEDQSTP